MDLLRVCEPALALISGSTGERKGKNGSVVELGWHCECFRNTQRFIAQGRSVLSVQQSVHRQIQGNQLLTQLPDQPKRDGPKMTDELLNPEKLLFVRARLEAEDTQALSRLLLGAGDADLRSANISILLPLLHEAREKDGKVFWTKLFLPWISIQRSVAAHHDRILREFVRIGEFGAESQELLVHLVNLYRSLVADLIDPYMTLLVACFQFIEGEFTNMQDANVGLGERNKAEYLESRIRKVDPEKRLLSGYEPIVRNAVTHTGSGGLAYRPDGVLFRNVKRGTPQAVEAVEWSRSTLVSKIVSLYECIASVDAAVNVFGVDCGELLLEDEDVRSEFIQRALTPERRSELRAPFEELMERVREDKNITPDERIERLSQILLYNLTEREMPVSGIGVNRERRAILVEIPDPQKDFGKDEILRDAVMECGHYGVLARSVFGEDFDHYVVRTISESGQSRLSTVLPGELLGQYIEERAGLYDLLHEAHVRLNGNRVIINVDFDKVTEAERVSLDAPFPRKNRPRGSS